jgi:hypothetical protein
MELTTYRGHCNLLGVASPVADFRVSTRDELSTRLSEARQRGAAIGVNHPYKDCAGPGCRWEWGWDIDHDWVEVWNGLWRQCNAEALCWWQGQLAVGRRIVAVGGSDTHRPNDNRQAGTPTNSVWSPSRSSGAVLEAVREGHLFISYSPQGPSIDLRYGPYMMGDEAQMPFAGDVQLAVHGLSHRDIVKTISERGVEQEIAITDQSQALNLAWPPDSRRFYRVEVWRHFAEAGQTLLAAMSNPIYFG